DAMSFPRSREPHLHGRGLEISPADRWRERGQIPRRARRAVGIALVGWLRRGQATRVRRYTDLRKFLDTSVSSISGHIAGASYRAGEAGAQATAQSERTKPVLVANRFHAVSQASMMSARLRNTELASQWLRR